MVGPAADYRETGVRFLNCALSRVELVKLITPEILYQRSNDSAKHACYRLLGRQLGCPFFMVATPDRKGSRLQNERE